MRARRRQLLLLLVAACEGPRGRAGLIDFLADGSTTRDEALLRLGAPAASYEADRVLIWTLGEDSGFYLIPPGGMQRGTVVRAYDLALIFDAAGILRRHGLAPRQP
jgi:hypothetical protein